MTVAESYSRHAVVLDTDAESGTPVTLAAVVSLSPSLEAEVKAERTTGEQYARHIAVNGIKPRAGIETYALQDWLDEIGLTGKAIASDSQDGLELYLQKFDAESGPASSGHRSLTVKQGLIVPTRLTCRHGEDARLQYQIFIVYDGTNDPFVISDSASLPSVTDNERFTLGAVSLGGNDIAQITELEIDFGIDARTLGTDSDIYDTRAEIRAIEPKISLKTTEVSAFGSSKVPLAGLVCTHANSEIYLRKRAQTASHFVADGTAEHVKITFDGIATINDAGSQSGDDQAETGIDIMTRYDGSNTPLVFDTSSAIT